MKDNLLELLMNFFEKSLSKLTRGQTENNTTTDITANNESDDNELESNENSALIIRAARNTSIRIFTAHEQIKFTKASYQFLTRMLLWGIIASETLELVINQLSNSESRFVTLQETKWTIRNLLAENLDESQLAFLDLVLYQKEDKLPLH
ncbi:Uncharacterized protein conserved in bacteria [Legionella beliardensis]|uniref:Uncharacterized protein conserved in bacteria n=1 Tax=Legionella beliardensis TaxID=91822 RepID=A0A378I485_9GAMM|nr:DUF494 family protein [Legionella beliardensis]STX29988.1 Uncharacterized protein conserved in bacteria [Legionella beliardensis]